MRQSSTPWSNRPEGRPTEQFGVTQQTLDPEIPSPVATAAAFPSPDRSRPPPRRGVGTLVGIGIAIVLLVAAGCLFRDQPSDPTATGGSASTSVPGTLPDTAAAVKVGRGLTVGNVSANDGTMMKVQGLRGATTVVHTNPHTRVLVLFGTQVSDVKVGDTVVVHGDKWADGSITAKLIVGAYLGFSAK